MRGPTTAFGVLFFFKRFPRNKKIKKDTHCYLTLVFEVKSISVILPFVLILINYFLNIQEKN
jgi:hypothetical protein